MPFGNQAGPTRVYSYGASPVENEQGIRDQLFAAHRYRNTLCELELTRRQRVEEALARLAPDFSSAKAAWEQANADLEVAQAEVKMWRKQQRKKTVAPEKMRKRIASLRELRKEAAIRMKDKKQAAFNALSVRSAMDQLDAADRDRRKAARADCGVGWGTYLEVEKAASAFRRGSPPRFQRFRGDGKLAVQIQKGIKVDDLLGKGHGQVEFADAHACSRGGPIYHVRIRLGSDAARKPIWGGFDVVLHRPLPKDARVKWVFAVCRRVACHAQWSVQFVLERAEGWARPDGATSGRVAVDLGWRKVAGGLRVAYWIGDDGRQGELILPDKQVRRPVKSADLRSIRDNNFNALKLLLGRRLTKLEKPAWLQDATRFLVQWRSPARLAALVIRWRDQRFPGDEVAFHEVETWRKQDKHLYEWEMNNLRKFRDSRTDAYRVFARTLRRQYGTLVMEKIDWRQLAVEPAVEEGDDLARVRARRLLASPSHLESSLRGAFSDGTVEERPARGVTWNCHVCGEGCDTPDRAALVYECRHCGSSWDQDRNACLNLLASGEVATAEG